MNVVDIIKNSFNYAINDWKKLLIFGVLFLVAGLADVFKVWGVSNSMLFSLLSLVSFIVLLFISGFELSIIQNTLKKSDIIPEFDLKNNLILGIKSLVLAIIYGIIFGIILLIIAIITGGFSAILDIGMFVVNNPNITTIPTVLVNQTIPSIMLCILLFFIVGIIAAFLIVISECRLAKYNSLSESLNILAVFSDIKAIGIGNYIVWFILVGIVFLIILAIGGLISAIPYVGVIIGDLVFSSLAALFYYRSLGLLYSKLSEDVPQESIVNNAQE